MLRTSPCRLRRLSTADAMLIVGCCGNDPSEELERLLLLLLLLLSQSPRPTPPLKIAFRFFPFSLFFPPLITTAGAAA